MMYAFPNLTVYLRQQGCFRPCLCLLAGLFLHPKPPDTLLVLELHPPSVQCTISAVGVAPKKGV